MATVGVLTALFKLDTRQAEAGAKRLKRSLGKNLEGSLSRMASRAGIAGEALASLGGTGFVVGLRRRAELDLPRLMKTQIATASMAAKEKGG